MGYELELIIGTATPAMADFDRTWGRGIIEYARVDLSNPGYGSHILALKSRATELHVASKAPRWNITTHATRSRGAKGTYEINISKDSYGDPVVAIPLRDVYEALQQDFEASKDNYGGQGYRRFEMALALIEVVLRRFQDWDSAAGGEYRLVALTRGH